jgi:hypothetical protein
LKTAYVIVVVLLVTPALTSADDAYPTNLELVERTVRAAIDSMEIAPPAGGSPELEIMAGAGGDAAWLLDSVLKERLLAMGWKVLADKPSGEQDSVSEADYKLKMEIVDLGLKYGRSWRRFLLVGKMVERIARVSIYYELIEEANGRIIASSNARSETRDVVPASLLPELSDSKHEFAAPEVEKTQWDRYLEGGLVLAIVGVLVYLFYSNKTAS